MFETCVFDLHTMWPIYALSVIWGFQLMLLVAILIADQRIRRSRAFTSLPTGSVLVAYRSADEAPRKVRALFGELGKGVG